MSRGKHRAPGARAARRQTPRAVPVLGGCAGALTAAALLAVSPASGSVFTPDSTTSNGGADTASSGSSEPPFAAGPLAIPNIGVVAPSFDEWYATATGVPASSTRMATVAHRATQSVVESRTVEALPDGQPVFTTAFVAPEPDPVPTEPAVTSGPPSATGSPAAAADPTESTPTESTTSPDTTTPPATTTPTPSAEPTPTPTPAPDPTPTPEPTPTPTPEPTPSSEPAPPTSCPEGTVRDPALPPLEPGAPVDPEECVTAPAEATSATP